MAKKHSGKLNVSFFVTGFPGSGKSSISAELRRRGHTSYDTDNTPGWAHLLDRHTHKPVAKKPRIIPPHYYDSVAEWDWDRAKLEHLIENATGDIFICAVMSNQASFYRYFDEIFVLQASSKVLKQRLLARSKRNFTNQPNELYDVLKKHKNFEQELINHGALAINAEKPLTDVVASILKQVHSAKKSADLK